MEERPTILVAAATGFVGQRVVRALVSGGIDKSDWSEASSYPSVTDDVALG